VRLVVGILWQLDDETGLNHGDFVSAAQVDGGICLDKSVGQGDIGTLEQSDFDVPRLNDPDVFNLPRDLDRESVLHLCFRRCRGEFCHHKVSGHGERVGDGPIGRPVGEVQAEALEADLDLITDVVRKLRIAGFVKVENCSEINEFLI
jgi:hypothetical protein